MIGATGHADAISEAQRSLDSGIATRLNLEVWDKKQNKYVPVE